MIKNRRCYLFTRGIWIAAIIVALSCVTEWNPSEVAMRPLSQSSLLVLWSSDSLSNPTQSVTVVIKTAHQEFLQEKTSLYSQGQLIVDTLYNDNPTRLFFSIKNTSTGPVTQCDSTDLTVLKNQYYFSVFENGLLSPPVPLLRPLTEARKLYTSGKICFDHEFFSQAKTHFRNILVKYPQDALCEAALYYLGRIYFAFGVNDSAKDAFNSMLYRYPQSIYKVAATYFLGQAYFCRGEYDSSLNCFQKIINSFPGNTYLENAYYFRAQCFYLTSSSNYETAIKHFSNFIDTFPASKYNAAAHFYLAMCYYRQKNFSEAINWYSRFLDLLSVTSTQYRTSAYLFRGKSRVEIGGQDVLYAGALDDLANVLKDASDTTLLDQAYEPVGLAYFFLKNYTYAKYYFPLAEHHLPTAKGYLYHIKSILLFRKDSVNCVLAKAKRDTMKLIFNSPQDSLMIKTANSFIDSNCSN
jgi:TolA-binding protein